MVNGMVAQSASPGEPLSPTPDAPSIFLAVKPTCKRTLSMAKKELMGRHREFRVQEKQNHNGLGAKELSQKKLERYGLTAKEKPQPDIASARLFGARAIEPQFVWDDHGKRPERVLLPPGSRDGDSFPIVKTRIWELGAFGPGIGLLFHVIRGLGIAMVICGVGIRVYN